MRRSVLRCHGYASARASACLHQPASFGVRVPADCPPRAGPGVLCKNLRHLDARERGTSDEQEAAHRGAHRMPHVLRLAGILRDGVACAFEGYLPGALAWATVSEFSRDVGGVDFRGASGDAMPLSDLAVDRLTIRNVWQELGLGLSRVRSSGVGSEALLLSRTPSRVPPKLAYPVVWSMGFTPVSSAATGTAHGQRMLRPEKGNPRSAGLQGSARLTPGSRRVPPREEAEPRLRDVGTRCCCARRDVSPWH